ncbi:MAG: type II secretion system ATPase GspE [Pseudomonadota bacterium]
MSTETSKTNLLGLPIGQVMKALGFVSDGELQEALTIQKEKGGRLGEILLEKGMVQEEEVARALAVQFGHGYLEKADPTQLDPGLIEVFPISYAKQHLFAPIRRVRSQVIVACADPTDSTLLDDLGALYGTEIEPMVTTKKVVLELVNVLFDRRSGAQQVMGDIKDSEDLDSIAMDLQDTTKDLLEEDDEAPIIRLVNSIFAQAIKEKASDIHIEPFERHIVVRFRRDGVMHEVLKVPKRLQASVTSRIKIMGDLNIAEKRRPQDGRIRIRIAGRDVDVRLSAIPIAHGESLVMRLLDTSSTILDLVDLGMQGEELRRLVNLIERPHGIILVTGPTGSGKTTTLYAALSRLNTPDRKILTIEDPIEYQLAGINQMQVNAKIDVTFASALRAFLRQDPDVILVGEIRDFETVEIAIQASLTGHMVFSTVHTNDAASTFTRLTDMGVEPFLISSSVLAVQAQRLVRVACTECRVAHQAGPIELRQLGITDPTPRTIYKAEGCEVCAGTGYAGRKGIFEVLSMTDAIRELVMSRADASKIKRKALEEGMSTLRQDGVRKVLSGMTTMEEVLRVTQEDQVV